MTEREEGPGGHGDDREPALPADEEAAWAQIVAAYDDEPRATSDTTPEGTPDDQADGDTGGDTGGETGGDTGGGVRDEDGAGRSGTAGPSRSFTVYAAGTGPRDWQPPDGEDDDHFVPPEPPPLPEADTVTKFGWVGALGGPLLLLGAVLFDIHMSWWIITLGVGGFLGGFATLLTRLREDDDLDDPGGGAVV